MDADIFLERVGIGCLVAVGTAFQPVETADIADDYIRACGKCFEKHDALCLLVSREYIYITADISLFQLVWLHIACECEVRELCAHSLSDLMGNGDHRCLSEPDELVIRHTLCQLHE